MHRSGSIESENGNNLSVMSRSESTGAGLGTVPRDNLTPWEELQLVRRQVRKKLIYYFLVDPMGCPNSSF